ncbi:MAG: glutamyl-tRNA reductase, partial [Candidatus Binatia bacterium]
SMAPALARLRAIDGVEEAALVSTCNRVEALAFGGDDRAVPGAIGEFLARERGVTPTALAEHLVVHHDRDAVRHLFRVASSLDSMVVGEPQILGQLKSFYNLSAEAQTAGAVLHRVFHKAFSVAKRVRTETGIAARSVSVSSVAVDLARQIFESLTDKNAMVIGAGKMAELVARHLQSHGIGSMMFANRTFDRAVELARSFHGTPVPFEDLARYLRLADVVLGSTAATGYLLTAEMLQEVQRERAHRPMFLIDLAVPRNFDPKTNDVDGVYLYDIDDLQGVAAGNRDSRIEEAKRAEAIVEEEVESFWRWFRALDVVPTIVALREKLEEIRRGEIEKTLGALPDLGEAERQAIEAMSEAIVAKILHDPLSELRRAEADDPDEDLSVARRLFGLDKARTR